MEDGPAKLHRSIKLQAMSWERKENKHLHKQSKMIQSGIGCS